MPPRFEESMAPLTVNEGSPFRLIVKAVGIPLPTLTWSRNGVILKHDDDRSNCAIDTVDGRSVLSVDQSTKKHDGTYRCEAKSAAGTATACARVTVRGRGYL